MALIDIVAQQLAANTRARLQAQADTWSPLARAISGLGERSREKDAEADAGLPPAVAGLAADAVVPPGPAEGRRAAIDSLVRALGAWGGAKLLAKLAFLSDINRNREKDALALVAATAKAAGAAADDLRADKALDIRARDVDARAADRDLDRDLRMKALMALAADRSAKDADRDAARKALGDYRSNVDADRDADRALREKDATDRAARANDYLNLARGTADRLQKKDAFGKALAIIRASLAPFKDVMTAAVDLNKWAASAAPALRAT